MSEIQEEVARFCHEFQFQGEVTFLEKFGRGHLHHTFLVRTRDASQREHTYVVQRVNTEVFAPAEQLARNTRRVLAELQRCPFDVPWRGKRGESRLPEVVPSQRGGDYVVTPGGGLLRAFTYVANTESLDRVRNADDAVEAGRVAGWFLKGVAGVPEEEIPPMIPGFQDTMGRCEALDLAIKEDLAGRVSAVREEIAFAQSHREEASLIGRSLREALVPRRITHGDMKLNNILFDVSTRKAVCFVDIDTAMPGTILYDFADLTRTAIATSAEDERDISRIAISTELFAGVSRGFLEIAGDILSEAEKKLLPLAPLSFVVTAGIRFLTDFLRNDVYFGRAYETHNLDRCRAQFRQASLMKEAQADFTKSVSQILG